MIKKITHFSLLLFFFLLLETSSFGQLSSTPKGILFQAAITDSRGNSASQKTVYIQDALIQKTANGTVVYSESFQVTASDQGLITIVIGQGTRISGAASIADIDWSAGPFYFNAKVAVAPSSSTIGWVPSQNFVDLGTSPFWAVPYAMYAAKAEGVDKKLNILDTAAMLKPYADNKNVVFSSGINGLVPSPGKAQGRYLSDNGTWLPFIDTVLLNNKINKKLNIADTSTMLSGYARIGQFVKYSDTSTMLTGYAKSGQSVRYSDTALMVSNRLKVSDTSTMLTGYAKSGQSVKYSDTASMIANHLKISDTSTMLTGYAKSGHSVRYSDTTTMLSGYAKSGQSAKYSDTSAMLSNRLKISDTTTMLSGYAKSGQFVKYSDTASMVSNRFKISDTATALSNRLKISDTATMLSKRVKYSDTALIVSNRLKISDTTTMLSGYAKSGQSAKYSDTSAMLSNRLKISDTTTMLSGYAKSGQFVKYSDTASMVSNRFKISDTATALSNRLKISDTATMLSKRVKYSDTALMVLNRLKISDTTTMLSGYAKSGQFMKYSDTASMLSIKAPLASPVLTGTPLAPTASQGTNTTQIATTAFVNSAVLSATPPASVLTGSTLASNVTSSSLTSLGTLSSLTVTGTITGGTFSGSLLSKSVTVANINASGTASNISYLRGDGQWFTPNGAGTVTSVSVVTANGVSASVTNPSMNAAITLTLGDITPASIVTSGGITGTTLAGTLQTASQPNITSVGSLTNLAVLGDALVDGTITGTSGIASSATSTANGIGYTSGGSTVAQTPSKSASVTVNGYSGQITMDNNKLNSGSVVSFVVNNSVVKAKDVPLVVIASGATIGRYTIQVDAVTTGSFTVSLYNNSGSNLTEIPVLNFIILKGN